MADITNIVDKAFEQQNFADLAEAPISALQGVSEADAVALKTALGIKTIRDLATNKYIRWAQAIVNLSGK